MFPDGRRKGFDHADTYSGHRGHGNGSIIMTSIKYLATFVGLTSFAFMALAISPAFA